MFLEIIPDWKILLSLFVIVKLILYCFDEWNKRMFFYNFIIDNNGAYEQHLKEQGELQRKAVEQQMAYHERIETEMGNVSNDINFSNSNNYKRLSV